MYIVICIYFLRSLSIWQCCFNENKSLVYYKTHTHTYSCLPIGLIAKEINVLVIITIANKITTA